MKHNGFTYKPIIFSLEMVQAILDGRKTQTRRLHEKPAYAVGDRLWVRETWRPRAWDCEGFWLIEYESGAQKRLYNGLFINDDEWSKEARFAKNLCQILDKRGCPFDKDTELYVDVEKYIPWKPSIHMPFGAHRIELEVTGVKQERLQDISEADAIAEGVERLGPYWRNYTGMMPHGLKSPQDAFASLWSSIHGHENWEQNPMVHAYTFKRLTL